MPRIRSLWVASALFLSLCASPARGASAGGVSEVDSAWKKAMLANDLEAVVACYAPDAVLWLPDTPEARGEKAIRESYRQFFSMFSVKDVSFPGTRVETVGARSLGWGKFSLTLLPKGSDKPVVMAGRFVVVAEKRGDRWVYTVDHASAEPALPKP